MKINITFYNRKYAQAMLPAVRQNYLSKSDITKQKLLCVAKLGIDSLKRLHIPLPQIKVT